MNVVFVKEYRGRDSAGKLTVVEQGEFGFLVDEPTGRIEVEKPGELTINLEYVSPAFYIEKIR